MSDLTWADIERLVSTLPPDPIAPENRNVARLLTSPFVPRGQLFRVSAGFFDGENRPIVLINDKDAEAFRAQYRQGPCGPFMNIDQMIADWVEQKSALLEAKEGSR